MLRNPSVQRYWYIMFDSNVPSFSPKQTIIAFDLREHPKLGVSPTSR
jgi:hypothetical protein